MTYQASIDSYLYIYGYMDIRVCVSELKRGVVHEVDTLVLSGLGKCTCSPFQYTGYLGMYQGCDECFCICVKSTHTYP